MGSSNSSSNVISYWLSNQFQHIYSRKEQIISIRWWWLLLQYNMLCCVIVVLANWNNTPHMDIWTKATSPCLLIFLHVALLYEPSQPFVVLIPKCSVPKATNTSLLVVILSQLWIESTMLHIRAEYVKHYTIYDIAFVMVIVKTNHLQPRLLLKTENHSFKSEIAEMPSLLHEKTGILRNSWFLTWEFTHLNCQQTNIS